MDGQEPTKQGQEPATEPNEPAAPGAPAAQGQQPVDANAPVKVDELPANVQNLIKSLRDENANHRKAKDTADKVAQEAQEKQMAENAEWQKLYEKGKTTISELAPKAELADKLTDLVTAQYAAEIKDWPAEVKAMAPGDDASILAKLEWANKARPLATELLKDKAPVPGNGSRPKPVGAAGSSQQQKIEPPINVRRSF